MPEKEFHSRPNIRDEPSAPKTQNCRVGLSPNAAVIRPKDRYGSGLAGAADRR